MNSFKRKLSNDTNFNPPPFSLVNIFNSLVGIGCIPVPLIWGRVGGRGLELEPIKTTTIPKIFLSFSLSISPLLFSQVSVSFVAAIWANHEFLWAVITGGFMGMWCKPNSPLYGPPLFPRRRRYVPDHLVDSVSSIFHSWKH